MRVCSYVLHHGGVLDFAAALLATVAMSLFATMKDLEEIHVFLAML